MSSSPQETRETESKVIDLSQTDSVVTSVVQSFLQRAEFGFKKYGKTMDRDDLTMLQWIQHAQEEHMDAILYLEKLKQLEMTRAAVTVTPTVTVKSSET